MPLLLVSSIGGSPEPIAATILHDRPDQVLFLCSAQTRPGPALESLLEPQGLLRLVETRHPDIVLPNAQDLSEITGLVHKHATPLVLAWADRSPAHQVLVDFTGGTKCMSAALCLVAQRWPSSTFRYVGGSERTKDGIGVVINGREMILESQNPWNALGFQSAQEAMLLADRGSYGTAAASLDAAARNARAPHIIRALQTLRQVMRAFYHWDIFAHQKALDDLRAFAKNRLDLDHFIPAHLAPVLNAELDSCRNRLEDLLETAEPRRRLLLVHDLLGNASRRLADERFDDAVSRCYRAIEAFAQYCLHERHDIPSTKQVPLGRIPLSGQSLWAARADGGSVMLALQDSYRLLELLGDPAASTFRKLGFADPSRSPLSCRNDSILAHGWQPVAKNSAEQLFAASLQLAGVTVHELPRFPKFLERAP